VPPPALIHIVDTYIYIPNIDIFGFTETKKKGVDTVRYVRYNT